MADPDGASAPLAEELRQWTDGAEQKFFKGGERIGEGGGVIIEVLRTEERHLVMQIVDPGNMPFEQGQEITLCREGTPLCWMITDPASCVLEILEDGRKVFGSFMNRQR